LKDHGDKVSSEIKDDVTAKITSLNDVKSKDNKEDIATATEALSSAMQKIGETMNKETATETSTEATKDGEQVRDAEVKEENSDNTGK